MIKIFSQRKFQPFELVPFRNELWIIADCEPRENGFTYHIQHFADADEFRIVKRQIRLKEFFN